MKYESCCSPKHHYLAVGQNGVVDANAFANMQATLMVAFSLNKPVVVYFDSASSSCYIGGITISN